MEGTGTLDTLGEKTLHQAADPDLVAYCPSMDLVALVTTDQQVFIYRLNGQRVYGAAEKPASLRVQSLRWKPNGLSKVTRFDTTDTGVGQLLAISWSDGSVRLISAESTKVVHHFNVGGQVSGVTCMGWVSNLTTQKAVSANGGKESKSWRNFLADYDSSEPRDINLPRDLALIDIEPSLPKLSVLPAGGGLEDVFSSGSSMDSIFRSFDPKSSNAVDVMVVGTKEGRIHLSIYDSFVVGSFDSPVMLDDHPYYLISHASQRHYSTHALLWKSPASDGHLYFVPIDLRFVSASSQYLSLLASRSSELQNLLRYIHQVQALMISEWNSMQELPRKFLRNINETLAESDRNIVQALYHSVATGHAFPAVREWLVDELAERGHKRWDKSITTGLENLRRFVHENMLPALDRCTLILSRFDGIARFEGVDGTVGFTSEQICLIIDTVACLHLLSSKILLQIIDELDLFGAFSTWLRYEIDRLASENSSAADDEIGEKEALIDHGKVLLYLQTAMMNSPLADFLHESSDSEKDKFTSNQNFATYGQLDKQLQEQGVETSQTRPRVDLFCKLLTERASSIFSQIAEEEKRNVLFGASVDVGVAQKDVSLSMRINAINHNSCLAQIAFVPDGLSSHIQVIQIFLTIENGISSTQNALSAVIQLGDGIVKDMKFADDNTLLVLWDIKGSTSLLSISTQTPPEPSNSSLPGDYHIEYVPHLPHAETPQPDVLDNDKVTNLFQKCTIPSDDHFVPARMEVRHQDGRIPKPKDARIIISNNDGLRYKVFRLMDLKPNGHEGGDEDIQMTQ